MNSRHRFVRGQGLGCAEAFGGVARCALPVDAPVHWRDNEHPYKPVVGVEGCGYVRVGDGRMCRMVRGAEAHTVRAEAETRTDYGVVRRGTERPMESGDTWLNGPSGPQVV